jgi:hemoglobin-like flavoprotein
MSLDASLLQHSLELVSGREARITERFYDILFARYPQVRPLFGRDRREQAAMLQESIVAVLDHLDDARWLEARLHGLGRRHVDYGVTAEMYPWVAECLVATFAEVAAEDWTPEMEQAWFDALGVVSDLMLAGYPDGSTGDADAAA